jgi:AraC family transcriptional regulator, positive regulator of tynA and feaB
MQIVFSTASVHPRDRLDYWREEATKAFVTHQFSTKSGRKFSGQISASSLGQLRIVAVQADPCTVARTERCLKSAGDDELLLCRQMGCSSAHQDGRDAGSGPGDIYLLDPRRPFSIEVGSTTNGLIFKVPRAEFEARLGNIARYTALALSPNLPVAALASDFLCMVANRADAIDQSMGDKIVQQALDLVAIAFETVGRDVAQLSSTRAMKLTRLKSVIETRLQDPTLKPAIAAEIAGISVRYANALLAQEDTSLERYIVLRRLLRCRQTLENPRYLSRSIGEIAYGCGFSDLSHFTRRFKEQFGCTPRDFRVRPQV